MTKRKDLSSPSPFSLKISEPQKKTTRRDEPDLAIRWDLLPTTLWLLATKYLTLQELVDVSLISKMFVNVFIERIIKSCKKEFPMISSFDPEQYTNYSMSAKLSLFNTYKEQYDLYFTLINRSYIPLFSILNKYDQEAAIQFVHSKLQSISIEGNQENVTDMVFFQKNSQGHTVINIAQRLGLQDFLDYCFEKLILNGMDLNTGKYSLIRPGRYAEVLQGLETEMSKEALWMYGCAYVCDQKQICREISSKPFWRKTWVNPEEDCSMILIAALLSSVNLAKHILEGIDPGLKSDMFYVEAIYEPGEAYYNSDYLRCFPIDAAAFSKNSELIDCLVSFSASKMSSTLWSIDLYAFYIYSKDILGIKKIYDLDKHFCDETVKINHEYLKINYDDYQLSVLGVAVAKNWLPGVKELIRQGLPLNALFTDDGKFAVNPLGLAMYFGHIEIAKFLLSRGADVNGSEIAEYPEPSPIFNAIEEGRLDCVQLLVRYGVSLKIKSRTNGPDEYPLISAILEKEGEIIQYLIETLGRTQALHQLDEELLLRPESGRERKLIGIVYDNLLKVTQPSGDVTFFSPGGEGLPKPPASNHLCIFKP